MDYLNFCKSYFSATSIPINLLDNMNTLYSSVRTVTNIPQYNDYYVPDDLPNCPCFSHYDPSIEYGIVRVQDTSIHIVIGPVFETEITPEILNAYLRENKIPFSERDKIQDFLCSIPRMNQLQLAKHLIFLHQAINNETCELSHFFRIIPRQQMTWRPIPDPISETKPKNISIPIPTNCDFMKLLKWETRRN